MANSSYDINIQQLTILEHKFFPETFDKYSTFVQYFFRQKSVYLLEDDILASFKDDPAVKKEWERGNTGMGAVEAIYPNRFARDTIYPKESGVEDEGVWGWFDLWSDYAIMPGEPLYAIFFIYKLHQTDLLALDNFLDYHLEQYEENRQQFIRFLILMMRTAPTYDETILQPEHIETIKEWIAVQEKEAALSGTEYAKSKGRVKRERDDKLTLLNQEQTALLIYCLRKTKVTLADEFLNNKDAGQAFSLLTGYSADTIRQNLSKTETAKTATAKNVEAVEMALHEVLKYIEKEIKPE